VPDRATPRYPELRVSIRSHNPLVLVAAVREELRLARAGHADIARFTDQALARPDGPHVLEVAEEWVGTVEAA
jgi:hypothetical protein